MPNTFSSLKAHVIFSTRKREPLLSAALTARLLPYLASVLRSEGCTPHAVNGYRDHLHAVFGFPPRLAISDVVRKLKGSSSKWVNSELSVIGRFAWQDGYAVYSVSPGRLMQGFRYVESQERHHRVKSFEEEYLEFLAMGGIEYDERYVFEEKHR